MYPYAISERTFDDDWETCDFMSCCYSKNDGSHKGMTGYLLVNETEMKEKLRTMA